MPQQLPSKEGHILHENRIDESSFGVEAVPAQGVIGGRALHGRDQTLYMSDVDPGCKLLMNLTS